VISNILVAIADGVLYQSASGSLASVTGTFNTAATQLQGAAVNNKYYIADYRPVNKTGTDGTIANNNQLSDSAVSDWTTLSIDTDLDVVYISGTLDTEANIFPITSVTTTHIVFNGTMTAQSGGASWQLGRIPKVWDPANPTTAIANLMTTLPIAATNYRKGTVTIVNGVATLTDGSWSTVPAATAENRLTLTIPNTSGIGEQQYLVAKKDSNTQVTLNALVWKLLRHSPAELYALHCLPQQTGARWSRCSVVHESHLGSGRLGLRIRPQRPLTGM
jgi:hypothetical protein